MNELVLSRDPDQTPMRSKRWTPFPSTATPLRLRRLVVCLGRLNHLAPVLLSWQCQWYHCDISVVAFTADGQT